MVDVSNIFGIDISNIKKIYSVESSSIYTIVGISMNAGQSSNSLDFVFSSSYNPPDGDSVDFF